jgi:phytoene dehydrogenase-like protein
MPAEPSDAIARTRSRVPETVDVAVVGCGLGGLTAAAHLSRQGLRVACFDSHYVAGGCATHFQRRVAGSSYRFDIGLHYIGDCGPDGRIPALLREVGIEQEFVPLDPDGFDELVFPDFRFRIPADRDLYRDRLLELFPAERRGIDRYVSFVRQLHELGPKIDANDNRLNARLIAEILWNGRLLALHQRSTIAAFLETCTRDPRLRAVLLGQHGDYALPPSEAAAILHIGLADHYFRGAWYPKGGGQTIADKMAATVEAAGGSIHLRRGIDRILIEHGRAVGVRTEPRHGETFEVRAGTVVCNADLKRTVLDLIGPEQLPQAFVKRVRSFRMSGAVFLTCLGVRAEQPLKGLGAFNVWQFDDYDVEGAYGPQTEFPTLRGCYVTSASLKDPTTTTHAPPGVVNVEVMGVVPGAAASWTADERGVTTWTYKRSAEYRDLKGRLEADLIERLERLSPGSKAGIVFCESASPLTHTRFTRASEGAAYGLAMTPDQVLDHRPDFTGPIPGLYFAGASTRAHHGIMGALVSGRKAADAVLRDLARRVGTVPGAELLRAAPLVG